MPYEPLEWSNLPAKTTRINAARLAHMETQYQEVVDDIGTPGTPVGDALSTTIGAAIADSDVLAGAASSAVADAVLDQDMLTWDTTESAPPYPSAPTLTAVAIVSVDEEVIAWIDKPGTPEARIRDAKVIYPSGDTTGATDKAVVNAALAAYSRVVLMPGQWYQNGAYVIPTETHLHCEGPFYSTLVAGSNSNNVTNAISATPCTYIALTGRGSVIFDGNGSNQTRMDTAPNYAGWKNAGIFFCNVDGLRVQGITWKNTCMFGAHQVGVRNAYWIDNRVEQDLLSANQDGLDIGPACHHIWIDGLTGNTEDDVHSIFGKYSTSQKTVHPLYLPASAPGMGGVAGALYSAAGNDTHHIYVSRSHVDSGKNYFRLQAAEGSKLYEIHGDDIRHTGTTACRALVIFGEQDPAYITSPPASDGTDFHDITFNGFTGNVEALVYLDSHVSDVTITDSHLPAWGSILTQRSSTDPAPSIRRLVIDGVTSSQGNVAGGNNILTLTSTGMTLVDCSFVNLRLRSLDRIIANTESTLTAVEIQAVVGEILSAAFWTSSPVANTAIRLDIRSRSAVASWGTSAAPTSLGGATATAGTYRYLLEAS